MHTERQEIIVTYVDRYTEVVGESQIKDQDVLVHYFEDGKKGIFEKR